jgi:sulfotransferase family protein
VAVSSIADDTTFVVSTGRCGSTMLSRILSQHPAVLSLNEFVGTMFFSGTNINVVPDMDGRELWQVMSIPDPFVDSALRDGLRIPEIAYPRTGRRFGPDAGIPKICHTVLPALTDDPDGLYERLADVVPRWPRRTAGDHCLALFGYLARALGRRMVVERTGASLPYAGMLHEVFPQARFVHLHREGPDCALSMSRHPIYRYVGLLRAAAIGAGLPWPSRGEDIMAALPEGWEGVLKPPFDPERYMGYPLPLSWFGESWSRMTADGVAALRELPAGSWISLSYEDLLSDPGAELTRLAEFIGVPPTPEWHEFAHRLIHQHSAGTARARLSPEELHELELACAPGAEVIRSVDGR